MNEGPEQLHFVTGRLAEHALRGLLADLAPQVGFAYTVDVLPITVAALMSPAWISRHIDVPPQTSRVLIPGYCAGDLQELEQSVQVKVERGPRDLRYLPEFFGREALTPTGYGSYDIEILAEINHAPRLTRDQVLQEARRLGAAGADVIDIGCEPGATWPLIADCVKALRDEGIRVSVDSLNPLEIAPAARAGAELVLSVNASNRDAAVDWGVEVVVIPDDPGSLAGLHESIEFLANARIPLRIDPIVEPIGCGFAHSISRYAEVRERYPACEMMMGIGNITEMTDADSAGINILLLGICQELRVRSVLTTQVINWARTSVRECDLARRLVAYAVSHGVPPKHLEPSLVLLRDERLKSFGDEELGELARQIKDNNYRIFAERGLVHLMGSGIHLRHVDPFDLFHELMNTAPKNLDASHAFYLGYEMAKAVTALTLGKEYRQDEALDWGFLTVEERALRLRHDRGNS